MVRKMRDKDFQLQQQSNRFDPHIAPINEFVAALQDPEKEKWVPEVAPMHGGVDSEVLSLLRDPGPKTRNGFGSGFLCVENDDQTAERQCELFEEYGISPRRVLPWNAYPWYINRAPRAVERDQGAVVLGNLIDLLPDLRVVLLQGNDAADVWRRLLKRRPSLLAERRLAVAKSIHPGRQALWTRDADQVAARKRRQKEAYQLVAMTIGTNCQDKSR
jgi:hypothetical protein